MRKKKFMAVAAAVAMAAITAFSVGNTPSVKAADVTSKTPIDLEINGNYEEKQISKADSDIINKAFGYDYGTNNVIVCKEGSVGYIDYAKSSVPYWKVCRTDVFTPDLSRDDNGNLVVKTDDSGKVVEKEIYGSQDVYAKDKYGSSVFFATRVGENNNFLPSSNGKNADIGNTNYANNEVNTNMGSKTFVKNEYLESGWKKVEYPITDVYIVRIYYTTDDKINYNLAKVLESAGDGAYDVNGNYVKFESYNDLIEYNKDRTLDYTDFWILPEGVSTVLNFADETPAPTPSEDNYTVDLGSSQTISADTFAAILAENATKDVIIKSNNDVTFTFAKGTMTNVAGKTEYDFSTSINSTYSSSMPSYITSGNFVSQIKFNYSGQLPATANIRIPVGTQYAGQTLYYSLMNEDNTFAEVQAVVVDNEGYVTVKQSHCSSYVVTKTEPKLAGSDNTNNSNASNDNTANGGSSDNGNASNGSSSDNGNTSSTDNGSSSGNTATGDNSSTDTTVAPKTADMTPVAIYVIIAAMAMGVLVCVGKRKRA